MAKTDEVYKCDVCKQLVYVSVGGEGELVTYLVPIHKWPICPISVLREKFNPRNINHMPAVKFFARLDLDQICLFVDGHYLDISHVLDEIVDA